MEHPQLAEAIVQLARKRRILDRGQCARLKVLLRAANIASLEKARSWLANSGLMTGLAAKKLLEHVPDPAIGMFGDYVPLAHLADGGMGSVYLAGAPDGALVVIKTMKGQLAHNPEVRHRFEREVRYMMELKNPAVVQCLGHGAAEDGTLFMVLAFVESGDLKELAEGEGLPEAVALAIVWQVADALCLAQEKQLIHRDIKPANIFVAPDGDAQLADFGIARSTAETRTMLTMQGALVGSPYYMSPEQVIADPNLDLRSDMYALGAVLYYALAGTDPYKGKLQEVLHAHRTAPIPEVRSVRPTVTERTSVIIRTCMAKKREDRYKDPPAMRAALTEAIAALETPGTAANALKQQHDQLQATITLDLAKEAESAKPAGSGTDSVATIVADLNAPAPAAGDAGMTIAVAASDWGGGASTPAQRPAGPRFEGDLAQAHAGDWLHLAGDGISLALLARRQLVAGKLCEPPIDVCLRKYPVAQFRDACLKISRQHLRLLFDPGSGKLVLGDLGSGNGTFLDGQRLGANTPVPIEAGRDHTLAVAGDLVLRLRSRARQGSAIRDMAGTPAGLQPGLCGLDCQHALDAVALARPDNRPGMAYALVLRRLTIGGGQADLPLPGAGNGPDLELALYAGRWLHRAAGDEVAPWRPLAVGAKVAAGGKTLAVEAGDHQQFSKE